MIEEWKNHSRFQDYILISNLGRVKPEYVKMVIRNLLKNTYSILDLIIMDLIEKIII